VEGDGRFIGIANWSETQVYKNRNPPWVRLYSHYLDNYEFGRLPDIQKAHFFSLMLLASRMDNRIPWNPAWIAQKINATGKLDLESLVSLGILEVYEDASTMLAERKQDASEMLSTRLQDATQSRADTEQSRTSAILDGFDEFWQSYPTKVGKGDARDSWRRKAKDRPPLAELLAALEAQKQSARWQGGTIPNPATWLNQERWSDDASSLTAVGQNDRKRPEEATVKPKVKWRYPGDSILYDQPGAGREPVHS
jgi:hypothetical protein